MTPRYAERHTLENALKRYDESLDVPEYSTGEVDTFEKIRFYCFYKDGLIFDDIIREFYSEHQKEPVTYGNSYDYAREHKAEFGEWFSNRFPGFENDFINLYIENGREWNRGRWRMNYVSGKIEDYTTYNPDSKYDYYSIGGRWDGSLKTKNGEFVNECILDELDWHDDTDEPIEEGKERPFHYHENCPTFAIIVDGEWIEKGEMGWFAMASNEKDDDVWHVEYNDILKKLPSQSEVYLLDFHI